MYIRNGIVVLLGLAAVLSACGEAALPGSTVCVTADDCPNRACIDGRCADPDGDNDVYVAPLDDVAPLDVGADETVDTTLDAVLETRDGADDDVDDIDDVLLDSDALIVSDTDSPDSADDGLDAADSDSADTSDASGDVTDSGEAGDAADTGEDTEPAVPRLVARVLVEDDLWARGIAPAGWGGANNGIVDVGEQFGVVIELTNQFGRAIALTNVAVSDIVGGLDLLDGAAEFSRDPVADGDPVIVRSLRFDAASVAPEVAAGFQLGVSISGLPTTRVPVSFLPRDAQLSFSGITTLSRDSGEPAIPEPGEGYALSVLVDIPGAGAVPPTASEGYNAEPPLGDATLDWSVTSDSTAVVLVSASGSIEAPIASGESVLIDDAVLFVVSPTAEAGDAVCFVIRAEAAVAEQVLYEWERTWCTSVTFGTDPFCLDEDGDLYGRGPSCLGEDCDDSRADVYPGAAEVCDGRDNNCDDVIDNTGLLYFQDLDGDTWGNSASVVPDCSPGAGWVTRGGDCADNDNTRYPGAPEPCDGIDNNCNLTVDDGINFAIDRNNCGACGNVCGAFQNCEMRSCVSFCLDVDGDGFFGAGSCARAGEDCNDAVNSINPAALDICGNGVDENCDGFDEVCPSPCDYIAQDCGTGAKCSYAGAAGFVCMRTGTDPIGATCSTAAGRDSCAASGLCVDWNVAGVDTCHELCRDDIHCDNLDEACIVRINDAGDLPVAEICAAAPRCDPFVQNCAADERCDSWNDPRLATTPFRCLNDGTIPRGGDCTAATEACVRGNVCVGSAGAFACRPFCSLPSGAGCPGGFGCASIAGWPSNVGACVPL